MSHRSFLIIAILATLLPSIGCNNKEINTLKQRISSLEAEVKTLKEQPSLKTKAAVAFISPDDRGYDFASDDNGLLFAVNIENVEAFPGGVKYQIGVTNVYDVGLSGVELDLDFGGQTKKIDIPEVIQPGKRFVTPVSFLVENNNYPKSILAGVKSKGMRFIKQF